MFADIEADIYVMASADGRCDPADAPSLVNALVTEHVDMVVGRRARGEDRRQGLRIGDLVDGDLSRALFRRMGGAAVSAGEPGYRALTRRFVKSFPAMPSGFDADVELSLHASQLMIPVAGIELNAVAGGLPPPAAGGAFHLRGWRQFAGLLRETRPFAFYSAIAMVLWISGLALIGPAFSAWAAPAGAADGRSAAPILGACLLMAGFLSAGCGLILQSLSRSRVEQKRILFLTVPALGAH